jgi:hypothetical protein
MLKPFQTYLSTSAHIQGKYIPYKEKKGRFYLPEEKARARGRSRKRG